MEYRISEDDPKINFNTYTFLSTISLLALVSCAPPNGFTLSSDILQISFEIIIEIIARNKVTNTQLSLVIIPKNNVKAKHSTKNVKFAPVVTKNEIRRLIKQYKSIKIVNSKIILKLISGYFFIAKRFTNKNWVEKNNKDINPVTLL